MADFELDRIFLKSLSLDDKRGNSLEVADGPMMIEDDAGSDLMEIDGVDTNNELSYQPFQSSNDTPVYKEDKSNIIDIDDGSDVSSVETHGGNRNQEIGSREDSEHDSSSQIKKERKNSAYDGIIASVSHSLLSPTTLGAKLAIKSPLRLLPAPESSPETLPQPFHTSGDDSVDYEVDTDLAMKSYSTQNDFQKPNHVPLDQGLPSRRNMNVFHPRDSFSLFANDSVRHAQNANNSGDMGHFSRGWNAGRASYQVPGAQGNVSGLPFSNFFHPPGVSHPQTFQVHHHHYYNSAPPVRESYNTLPGESPEESKEHIGADRLALTRQAARFVDEHGDVSLPLPWTSSSTPSDKIPYMISSYLQLAANITAFCYVAFLVLSGVQTVRQDIKHKLSQQVANTLIEMESCKRSYIENNCSPDTIVPILEKPCAYWLKCMSQDPYSGGGRKSSISAETLGMIVNSLIEPLSLKFFLALFSIVLVIFACNFSFGFLRAKAYYGWSDSDSSHVSSNKKKDRDSPYLLSSS
ncbi:Piso0_002377 [Millerozyma farinosa CBS 7064]|uniref:Piso0_002377 protein n=1 Tax=Pichia sorbitophila (strain ATCC MYA-4447 / BCRC 22081 / CBS 7064 / NBRC 10061 / NRRL Y-12695) TaxID=559304 RepID=G8YCG2_PICSO|nr:Piso0_002377 [Millerozyma farinosa CBS 7064]